MARLYYKVALVDFALLVVLYYVLQDLAWRSYYAGIPHANVAGYAASTTYSFFSRFFTMAGGGATLVSPPTFDWAQLIVAAIIVINGWVVVAARRQRMRLSPAQGASIASAAEPLSRSELA